MKCAPGKGARNQVNWCAVAVSRSSLTSPATVQDVTPPLRRSLPQLSRETWAALVALCERTYPNEACGWIASPDIVRPATSGTRDSFAFSDEDLLAFIDASRSATPPVVLFHSHPDGDASLSITDHRALALHPLPHLVIAVAGGRAHSATLYTWRNAALRPIANMTL
jgi:proteasome lid subunit RPN8/RPN11